MYQVIFKIHPILSKVTTPLQTKNLNLLNFINNKMEEKLQY